MAKICSIAFRHHPVLGDCQLSFRGSNGKAVDTVIIAGENGCGKSTVMDSLYRIITRSSGNLDFEADVVFELDDREVTLSYYHRESVGGRAVTYVRDDKGMNANIGSPDIVNRYPMAAIYSDVDINFSARQLNSVTSMSLDEDSSSRRSTGDMPSLINQLLIDIQALDDADVARAARAKAKAGKSFDASEVSQRMPRFTSAFDIMFGALSYDRVDNVDGHKAILFKKDATSIPIESLSSGEKQIVYRGCFLLKDAHALDGAFVFVDEPEISLHPRWQSKILDYYKAIFTGSDGLQTSQLFVVTHSPFIVHGDNRANDKVIVLYRDGKGRIGVMDKPEYYRCESVEVVKDAFLLDWESADSPTVFVEGRTDESYFNAAVAAFGIDAPFRFKWIGHIDSDGQERNTGAPALAKAAEFFLAQGREAKTVYLFDCDQKKTEKACGNVRVMSLPSFNNACGMKKGIENALVLDSIEVSVFYDTIEKTDDYGAVSLIRTLNKKRLRDYVCALSDDEQRKVFANLREVIEGLQSFFADE